MEWEKASLTAPKATVEDDLTAPPTPPRRPPRIKLTPVRSMADPEKGVPMESQKRPRSPQAPIAIPTPMTPADVAMHPFYFQPNKASDFLFTQFRGVRDFTFKSAKSGLSVGEKAAFYFINKVKQLSKKWFTHIFLCLVVILYGLLGATLFVWAEAPHENLERHQMAEARHKMLKSLWNLTKMGGNSLAEEDWEIEAKPHIEEFQNKLFHSFNLGVKNDDKPPVWQFWNALFFCGTVFTTIGYGHITPATNTGRAITIVYACFGIPIFLILLADFGKLLTRGIKFLWAFVRRLYYTGSCKKVRSTVPVQTKSEGENNNDSEIGEDASQSRKRQGMVKGVREAYGMAAFWKKEEEEDGKQTPDSVAGTFTIDDEFNLPVTVAFGILIMYILCGAFLYSNWEDWSFFEAFYFVFVSMSTIGFGDYVPEHPMYMMASIVYLVFGLALTSMCINVVQEKLSDTFRMASVKIGATIGLSDVEGGEEDGGEGKPAQVEVAGVHGSSGDTKDETETETGSKKIS